MNLEKMLRSLTPLNLFKENNDGVGQDVGTEELVRRRMKLERGTNKWLKKRPKLKQNH